MNDLIAVIEDEPDLAALVSAHLRKEGFRVGRSATPNGSFAV